MISISDYIRAVRGRSEDDKKRAVLTWTIILIIIVFFIWVIYFSLSLYQDEAQIAHLQAEARQEAAKVAAQASLGATTSPASLTAKEGLLPMIGGLLSSGIDSVVNGFWVIGDMLHR